MVWFKVSDGLHSHRKTIKAGEAMALWVIAGSWCGDQLTDGFVPDYMVGRLLPGPGEAMAAKLVEVGLWEEATKEGERGYRFHGWDELDGGTKRNPTRADVEAQRAKWRGKKQGQRNGPDGRFTSSVDTSKESKEDAPGESPVVSPGDTPEESPRPRPVPTRSNTVTSGDVEELLLVEESTPDRFDDFWAAYPRRTHKAEARKAWSKALKEATADTIVEAAGKYAEHCKRQGTAAQYIAHPASWLNGLRWEDELPTAPASPWGMTARPEVNPWDVANVDPWAGKEV